MGHRDALKRQIAGDVVMLALLGLLTASCSYALALALRSEDALAPLLNTVTMPMLLLSLAPAWLRDVAAINPLSHAVDAVRMRACSMPPGQSDPLGAPTHPA